MFKERLDLIVFFGNGVIRVSHECLGSSKGENVRMVFQRCFDGVPSSRMFKVFKGCSKNVSTLVQGCFKEV